MTLRVAVRSVTIELRSDPANPNTANNLLTYRVHRHLDTMGDLSSSTALTRVAEFLKHPDDLNGVAMLKQKLSREKAAIDSQLKAGVQSQIEVTLAGMHSLEVAKEKIDVVGNNVRNVNQLSIESREAVLQFDKINDLSRVLRNFEETQMFINNFTTMQNDLQIIEQLMDADGDLSYKSDFDNLVEIHYRLSQLRDVEDEAMFHAQGDEDNTRTIKRHFSSLDRLVSRFDDTLRYIAGNALKILTKGEVSVLVRTAKILALEQKQDLAASISRDILTSKDKGNRNSALISSIHTTTHRRVRRYYETFFNALQSNVTSTFEKCIKACQGDPDLLLDQFEFVERDLEITKLGLVKCFPAHFDIMDKMVRYYHKHIYTALEDVMKEEPPAHTILHILEYVENYYKFIDSIGVQSRILKEKLNLGNEEHNNVIQNRDVTSLHGSIVELGAHRDDVLYPPLLDGKESQLYDDYLGIIVKLLHEWYNNMAINEKEYFVTRQVSPDMLADNLYGLRDGQTVFKLITQQLDSAAMSNQERILAACVEACSDLLTLRIESWQKIVNQQVALAKEATEDSDFPPGLLEYMIALANDQLRAAHFLSAISTQRSAMVGPKYKTQIISTLDSTTGKCLDFATFCVGKIAEMAFSDVEGPFKELYVSSAWYKGQPANQISGTLEEYAMLCDQHMDPDLFENFVDQLLRRLVLFYMDALEDVRSLKVKNAVEQVRKDVEVYYKMFIKPFMKIDAQEVQSQFRAFDYLIEIWQTPDKELKAYLLDINSSNDLSVELIEQMILVRKDLEKKDVREIIAELRRGAWERNETREQEEEQLESREQTYFLANYKPRRLRHEIFRAV